MCAHTPEMGKKTDATFGYFQRDFWELDSSLRVPELLSLAAASDYTSSFLWAQSTLRERIKIGLVQLCAPETQ